MSPKMTAAVMKVPVLVPKATKKKQKNPQQSLLKILLPLPFRNPRSPSSLSPSQHPPPPQQAQLHRLSTSPLAFPSLQCCQTLSSPPKISGPQTHTTPGSQAQTWNTVITPVFQVPTWNIVIFHYPSLTINDDTLLTSHRFRGISCRCLHLPSRIRFMGTRGGCMRRRCR
ncbi:hypothetical protein BC829DRAFT_214360 [Chytridium lagenaria]|nr:hypothetical protein BC829DRAFT_214360 [Chytridium lagenaria]